MDESSIAGESLALELRNIDKWFGAVHANDTVSLSVKSGTIHGIIGENGAGKSTLMSIVYGYYQADAGEILINNKIANISSPDQALERGIGMVHQHFMLVEPFNVLENIVLGAESGKILKPSLDKARQELARLERDYSLEVDPEALVGGLPVGIRQRVEILKALYRGADIFILDEPTSVLTPQEVEHLFRILRAIRSQGKTVILVTHKLREIMALTDNVTVMRQGKLVANRATKLTSREELAELMVGRSVLLRVKKLPAKPGKPALVVNDLRVKDQQGLERVKGVSFKIREGEIVGIAGVAGNGQSELLEALAGIRRPEGGSVTFKNLSIASSNKHFDPQQIRKIGAGHVPEDRQRMGLITSFNATESGILGYHYRRTNKKRKTTDYSGHVFLNKRAMLRTVLDKMLRFDVRPANPLLRTASFSGGNQQKIVLVREIDQDPDLLLVGQPTRGVDIGAIEFIHQQLIAMRDRGKAILLVSVELDEVLSLADRILVMFAGEIVGEMPQAEADEKALGLLMAGEQRAAKES